MLTKCFAQKRETKMMHDQHINTICCLINSPALSMQFMYRIGLIINWQQCTGAECVTLKCTVHTLFITAESVAVHSMIYCIHHMRAIRCWFALNLSGIWFALCKYAIFYAIFTTYQSICKRSHLHLNSNIYFGIFRKTLHAQNTLDDLYKWLISVFRLPLK